MFSVKKYSEALDKLHVERGVGGYFGHSLVSVDAANRKAVFKNVADGTESKEDYTLLHVTPPMGPLNVLKGINVYATETAFQQPAGIPAPRRAQGGQR